MKRGTTRLPDGVVVRALLVAAILIAVLVPRLGAGASVLAGLPQPSSSTSAIAEALGAPDLRPCDSASRFQGLTPLLEDPAGDVEALWATSERAQLSASTNLFVRVDVKPGVPIHRLLIDTDDDRMTGMWTAQSHLSDSGWDRMVASEGILFEHGAEHPDEWDWRRIKSPGLTVTKSANSHFFCVPVSELSPGKRVALTVETSWNSLPRRFLKGALYPTALQELHPDSVQKPKRMAFYYSGSPWIVRNCDSYDQTKVGCAARVFSRFKHVVFGARLEEESRGGHFGAMNLMRKLRSRSPKTELWGYVSFIGSQKNPDGTRDHVYPVSEYVKRAEAWKQMGATGIFLDEYDVCDPAWQGWCRPGPDGKGVLLTRARQVAIVDAIHSLGMAVFANSHSVQNALGTIDGVPSPLGGSGPARAPDMYLLENPTVVNGHYQGGLDYEAHQARFAQAVRLTLATGARLGVLDSAKGHVSDSAFTSEEYRVGWWQAAMANAHAYAYFADNLPILKPPVDVLKGPGLRFDSQGIRFLVNGTEVKRTVVDACGNAVGAIFRRRLSAEGDSLVGFAEAGAPLSGGCGG